MPPARGRRASASAWPRPTILAHGTEEQKQQFLPPIARGRAPWCQLFSEPGAGSDLAGLTHAGPSATATSGSSTARRCGSTCAHFADYGILLARTDADAPKHRGITYFLVDMHQPGVEVRPLRQMTGDAEFNEVFLTDAARAGTTNRVRKEDLVELGVARHLAQRAHLDARAGACRGGRT